MVQKIVLLLLLSLFSRILSIYRCLIEFNHISGVMFSVLTSSVVDHGIEPYSGQTKDYNIGICCFSAKHAALRRQNKDWLAWNQAIVSEWGDMSIRRRLFQWASTIKIQLSLLVLYKTDLIISLKINMFSPWYSWKISELQCFSR